MSDILKKEAVIRVQKAINDFDKNLKIQILNDTARTASDAAKALNCNVGAIVKSLLLKTDHEFVLCLVSGDKKCSLNKVKKLKCLIAKIKSIVFKKENNIEIVDELNFKGPNSLIMFFVAPVLIFPIFLRRVLYRTYSWN